MENLKRIFLILTMCGVFVCSVTHRPNEQTYPTGTKDFFSQKKFGYICQVLHFVAK